MPAAISMVGPSAAWFESGPDRPKAGSSATMMSGRSARRLSSSSPSFASVPGRTLQITTSQAAARRLAIARPSFVVRSRMQDSLLTFCGLNRKDRSWGRSPGSPDGKQTGFGRSWLRRQEFTRFGDAHNGPTFGRREPAEPPNGGRRQSGEARRRRRAVA
jgi:hypothetical protein